MESGRLAQVRRPFDFNRTIRLVALSHRAQADNAGLDFTIELDPRISQLDKFVGDEMRLRQVTSNLVSNALKFTPAGSVQLVTSLLFPVSQGERDASMDMGKVMSITEGPGRRLSTISGVEMAAYGPEKGYALSSADVDLEKGDLFGESEKRSRSYSYSHCQPPSQLPKQAVVRVEIRDTGVGIATDDLDDNRLFSPYVQTEIGRQQCGKGSGLGLALIRQIVELSGGRLGVNSQVGVGSTFW